MTDPEKMTIHEIVERLIGPIEPVGCSNTDAKRLDNLKRLTGLIDELLRDILFVSRSKISHEYSVRAAGEHASKSLKYIVEEYQEINDERS
jgi:hypothetical protein